MKKGKQRRGSDTVQLLRENSEIKFRFKREELQARNNEKLLIPDQQKQQQQTVFILIQQQQHMHQKLKQLYNQFISNVTLNQPTVDNVGTPARKRKLKKKKKFEHENKGKQWHRKPQTK